MSSTERASTSPPQFALLDELAARDPGALRLVACDLLERLVPRWEGVRYYPEDPETRKAHPNAFTPDPLMTNALAAVRGYVAGKVGEPALSSLERLALMYMREDQERHKSAPNGGHGFAAQFALLMADVIAVWAHSDEAVARATAVGVKALVARCAADGAVTFREYMDYSDGYDGGDPVLRAQYAAAAALNDEVCAEGDGGYYAAHHVAERIEDDAQCDIIRRYLQAGCEPGPSGSPEPSIF